MLVLTQFSVGTFVIDLAQILAGAGRGLAHRVLLVAGFVCGVIGLTASLGHLGRPRYAYRALIGLKHSWLSREVAAFSGFTVLATVQTALELTAPTWVARHSAFALLLPALTVTAGIAGLACSVMVYDVTRRPLWNARRVGMRFGATALLLGLASALAAQSWVRADADRASAPYAALALGIVALTVFKLKREAAILVHLNDSDLTPARRSATLLVGALSRLWRLRRRLGLLGGIVLPIVGIILLVATAPELRAAAGTLSLVALLEAELVERALFFRAVPRPKMPGSVGS
jgi:DMSO reductase anchor subunit